MTKKNRETALVLFKAAVALTLFVIAITHYDSLSTIDVHALIENIDNFGLAAGIILGLYILKSLVFVVPASLIYVAVGAIFGGFTASLLNMTGIFIEISLTYILGRFLSDEKVEHLIAKNKSGKKLMSMNLQEKSSLLFVIRLLPAFPIDFVSLFYGASKCGYFKYAILSVLGLAPRVIAFTILGSAAFDWIPLDKIILLIICCIPIGVVIYLIKKLLIDPRNNNEFDDEKSD